MVTHSSILQWEIPRVDEPGGHPLGMQRVGHDSVIKNNKQKQICAWKHQQHLLFNNTWSHAYKHHSGAGLTSQ